jgi:hypothetical protein
MLRCAGRIGCAIVFLILGAVGWHFRDRWLPLVKRKLGTIEVKNPIAYEPPLRHTIATVERA